MTQKLWGRLVATWAFGGAAVVGVLALLATLTHRLRAPLGVVAVVWLMGLMLMGAGMALKVVDVGHMNSSKKQRQMQRQMQRQINWGTSYAPGQQRREIVKILAFIVCPLVLLLALAVTLPGLLMIAWNHRLTALRAAFLGAATVSGAVMWRRLLDWRSDRWNKRATNNGSGAGRQRP